MTEHSFLIKIYKEDEFWIAEVLELGIATQGKTFEEALKNAKEAIEAYFEAWPEEKERIKKGLWTAIQIK